MIFFSVICRCSAGYGIGSSSRCNNTAGQNMFGMFEFGRQLAYKAAMTGARVVMADRWFPSSKTCSACGHVHTGLTLSDREWSCVECGVIHDRDRNAAINLMNFAASW